MLSAIKDMFEAKKLRERVAELEKENHMLRGFG